MDSSAETSRSARTEWNERLTSIDVFRGATIAAMLLVNNPGSWSHVYPPFLHAPWHGWTFTDLIFPFFLFIVGITTHLSLARRKELGFANTRLAMTIFKRGSLIVLLGLFLNAFPFFAWWDLPGNDDPTFLQRVFYRFEHMRFPGVLQRIGIAYIAGGLLSIGASRRRLVITTAVLLLGFWALMTLVPVPGSDFYGREILDHPSEVLSAWLDRSILGEHLWTQTKTWDPEGLLTTLPAIGTVLLGVLFGRLLAAAKPLEQRLNEMFVMGGLAATAGLIWAWFFPINKNLWSSSYTLFTAGIAALTLASVTWIIDVRGSRNWTRPFVVFGVNPMLAFVGSGLMARFIYSLIKFDTGDGPVAIQAIVYRTLYASWLPPKMASLLFAISFVLLWLAILWPLHSRRIIFRV